MKALLLSTALLLASAAERVYFVAPADGATVSSPVQLRFGIEGMGLAPAGELKDGTGHHHLIVDSGPVAKGAEVPKDAQHLHFGKGQSETELTLPPGEHTLTLQLADGMHRSYGPAMSQTIHIKVKP